MIIRPLRFLFFSSQILTYFDYVFTTIFAFEVVVKVRLCTAVFSYTTAVTGKTYPSLIIVSK